MAGGAKGSRGYPPLILVLLGLTAESVAATVAVQDAI
jgi:hypothetical protein